MVVHILALLAYVTVAIIMSILVMIKGWGLQPISWWWILGIGVFGQVTWLIVGEALKKSIIGRSRE